MTSTTTPIRWTLTLAVAAAFTIGPVGTPAGMAQAENFPERPLTMVVPAGTGGNNDRAARLMAGFLSDELGQPVQVVNRPGGGNMLGHVYFQQQPADGYTLMRTTAIPFMTINQLVQGANFEIEQFHPVNITDVGTSIVATSNDSPFESIEDVLAAIRDGQTVSVGVQPTATDFINLSLFMEALGKSTDDVRIVTYDSGGPVRNGIIGGQFDIGVVGDQGMVAQQGEFRPLMTFSETTSSVWGVPTVLEVLAEEGVEDYPYVLSGSMQGYFVHTELMDAYPERYERIVAAFEAISANEEAIEAHAGQDLGIEWLGPDASREMMLSQHEVISVPEILAQVAQD